MTRILVEQQQTSAKKQEDHQQDQYLTQLQKASTLCTELETRQTDLENLPDENPTKRMKLRINQKVLKSVYRNMYQIARMTDKEARKDDNEEGDSEGHTQVKGSCRI